MEEDCEFRCEVILPSEVHEWNGWCCNHYSEDSDALQCSFEAGLWAKYNECKCKQGDQEACEIARRLRIEWEKAINDP